TVVAEPVLERVVGCLEANAQRVEVDSLHTLDLLIVIERLGLARAFENFVEAYEPAIEDVEPVRAHLGIEDALDGIDVVFRDELALLALERRIVGEVDPGTHFDREGAAAVADLRQTVGGVRRETYGPREVIVCIERV